MCARWPPSDVVLENYKVGQLAKYGLDYASLSAINPRLVYCSITGFGQTGPYRTAPATTSSSRASAASCRSPARRDDQPGGGPQKVGVAVSDLMTGMYAPAGDAGRAVPPRAHRRGQHIDMALLDVQVAMLANMNMNYLTSGKAPRRWGNAHQNIVPYQVFAASDGHVIVAVGNDSQYAKFCEVGGRPIWRATRASPAMPTACATAPSWFRCSRRSCEPSGRWRSGPRSWKRPACPAARSTARGLRVDLPHPTAQRVPLVASPIVLDGKRAVSDLPPPLLGEHTRSVLGELLGLADAEVDALARDRIV
jgi:formyl-CoA transferase